MRDISLTVKESFVFGDVIGDEIRDLVNEYDPDTGRRPSKRRYNRFETLKDIYDRWTKTQERTKIAGGTEIVLLRPAKACRICLSDNERSIVEKLMTDFLKDAEGSPWPVQDDEFVTAENIIRKLQDSEIVKKAANE